MAQMRVHRFTTCCRSEWAWAGGALLAMHADACVHARERVSFDERLHLTLCFCMQSDLGVLEEGWRDGVWGHIVEGFGSALRPAPDSGVATGHCTAVHMEGEPLTPIEESIASLR